MVFNILKALIIFLICALKIQFIESLTIKDNFMLCKQNMNRPPIDLSKVCTTEKFSLLHNPTINEWFNSIPKTSIPITPLWMKKSDKYLYSFIELAILTKSQYYVSGDAFECKQTNFENGI